MTSILYKIAVLLPSNVAITPPLAEVIQLYQLTVCYSAHDASSAHPIFGRVFILAVNACTIGTGLTQAWFNQNCPNADMIELINIDVPFSSAGGAIAKRIKETVEGIRNLKFSKEA